MLSLRSMLCRGSTQCATWCCSTLLQHSELCCNVAKAVAAYSCGVAVIASLCSTRSSLCESMDFEEDEIVSLLKKRVEQCRADLS